MGDSHYSYTQGRPRRTITTGQGAHQHILAGANNVSIGSLSSTTVGGNYTSITQHSYPCSSTSEGDRSSKCSPYEILNWLKAPNFRPIQQNALAQRMLDTGIWFIESPEFHRFMGHKGSSLWGTGMPGAGKTVLSAISVEHLEKKYAGRGNTAVTFAFLRYNEGHTVRDIVAALLGQLISGNKIAFAIVERKYVDARRIGADPAERDLSTLLAEVTRALERLFVAVDGLDEAVDAVKDGLLRLLPPMGVNLLITSRPLPLLMRRIPDSIQVLIQARTEDIAVFVSELINRDPCLSEIMEGRPDLIDKLSRRIKESSQGMFLVARLQMEVVIENATSVNSIFKALEELPSELDQMYESTLQRVNAQSPSRVAIARRVFLWVLYAREALSIRKLQCALCIDFERQTYDPGDESPISTIIALCGGLITVEKRGGVERVRFVHYTTREYMEAVQFPTSLDGHAVLSVSCAIYLDSHPKIYQSAAEVAGGKQRDIRRDIRFGDLSKRYPLWYYSLHNWGEHASLSRCSPLHPYLLSFLVKHKRHYWQWPQDHLQVGGTALHFAMRYRLLETIQSKCLPCVKGEGDMAVDHHAARQGDFEVFQAATSAYGIDTYHGRDGNGDTFLHVAIRHGHHDFVKRVMCADNWDPTVNGSGHTPDLGIYINEENSVGETPFAIACRSGDVLLARLLALHKDCRSDFRLFKGGIAGALEEAAKLGDSKLFRSFLPAYEDDRRPNDNTPLQIAIRHGQLDFVQDVMHIRRAGTPNIGYINDQRPSGETPLMIACQSGDVELVRVLLSDRDCQPNLRSFSEEETALIMTCRSGDIELVRLLLSHEDCRPNIQNVRGETALMTVCGSKNIELVQLLVSHKGSGFNLQDSKGDTALILASLSENIQLVRLLLSHEDCLPNVQNADGETSLMAACRVGNVELVQLLASQENCGLNLQNSRGDTALIVACRSEDIELVRLLLTQEDCQPNIQNALGETALMTVCQSKNVQLVQLLASHDNCGRTLQDYKGNTALLYACWSENIELVRLLLSYEDCQLKIQNARGQTALMAVCLSKNVELAQLVASHKDCGRNLQDCEGNTALIKACRSENIELVRHLLAHEDCQPHAQNARGETALMTVCRSKNVKLMQLLASHENCGPNLQDSKGNTALIYACWLEYKDLVRLLLSRGDCQPNIQNARGETALMTVCRSKDFELVQLLASHESCGRTLQDSKGNTALIYACWSENIELVRLLLSYEDCRPNIQNAKGQTALMAVCRSKKVELVQLVASHKGCGQNLEDSKGDTALMKACRSENFELVRLLLSHEDCGSNAQSPLTATSQVEKVELVQLHASKANCGLNVQNSQGETALMIASRLNTRIVQLFASLQDCQPNLRNIKGESAFSLSCASCRRDAQLPAVLVQSFQNLDIYARDNKGVTPFMKACECGQVETVQFLLDQDSTHVAQVDDRGRTALMHLFSRSSSRHHPPSFHAIFQLLLKHGSSLEARDHDGLSAFLHAVARDEPKLPAGCILPCLEHMYNATPTVIEHCNALGQTALTIAQQSRGIPSHSYSDPDSDDDSFSDDDDDDEVVRFILSKREAPSRYPPAKTSMWVSGTLATSIEPRLWGHRAEAAFFWE